ncbi:MAG: hypothetical protein ACI32C_01545 [Candidatus Enteromonas sp.]
MAVITILLTVGICLSGGCENLSNAERIETMKESSSRLIQRAKESFDYSDFSLTEGEQRSFLQQKLFSFAKENKLYSEESLSALESSILNDSSYFDSSASFFRPEISIPSVKSAFLAEGVHWFSEIGSFSFETATPSKSKPINKDESFKGYDGSGGGVSTLPKKDFKLTALNVSFSSSIHSRPFFGIFASKDACIALYNFLADFLNDQVMYHYSGSGSLASNIISAIKYLSSPEIAPSALPALVASTIASITAQLSSFFSGFLAFIPPADPVTILLGIVLAVFVAAAVSVVVAMAIYGYLGKGFAVGWYINGLFEWEWFCGELA